MLVKCCCPYFKCMILANYGICTLIYKTFRFSFSNNNFYKAGFMGGLRGRFLNNGI